MNLNRELTYYHLYPSVPSGGDALRGAQQSQFYRYQKSIARILMHRKLCVVGDICKFQWLALLLILKSYQNLFRTSAMLFNKEKGEVISGFALSKGKKG